MLKRINLEKNWYIAKDENNTGSNNGWEKKIPDGAIEAYVPSIIQQFFPEYHGICYYWCKFTSNITVDKSERAILRFGGVDYYAQVWLNSVYLGEYEGGETPFAFDVTDRLNSDGENLLAVRVINPCERTIDGMNLMNTPHRNKVVKKSAGSNLNHGGILYGVMLSAVPTVYIEDKYVTGNIHTGVIDIAVTLNSAASAESKCRVSASVYENKEDSEKITCEAINTMVLPGVSEHKLCLKLDEFKLWSVDDPNLYRIELEVDTEFGCHKVLLKFGFREFVIKDGFFYLNGKKIFLKSSHSGNAFPIGQMHPVMPDHLRRDFIYAKSCGFNALRAIAGLFRPEQLDLADEIGILIYEECFASWCMGYSHQYTWNTKEEFEAISKVAGNMPLGDEEKMIERWIGATEKMILRDRNHPSVVIWGLLNETKNNGIFRAARDFLPRARELDPSRVILLNSGRLDFDFTVGSASNPYSTVWENTWGPDGNPQLWDKDNSFATTGDNHHYASAPLSKKNIKIYREMGHKTPLPFFLSECGIGANFNVIEEWKHFIQYGQRPDLEDASWLKYQSDAFSRDFLKLGVDKLFPFPDAFLKESQRVNANERKRIFDIIRSNPRFAGYSLTGLLDHGMCGEGLWSYWRRWKPEMFDTVCDGWSPLRFCLFAEPCVFAGQSFEIEASLANEAILKSGTYTADFAICGESGVIMSFSESFELRGDEFATHIMKRVITLDVPAGKYELCSSLREGAAAGNSTSFYVFEERVPLDAERPIYAIGFNVDGLNMLRSACINVRGYQKNSDGIILAGKVDAATVAELIDKANRGAKVLFLDVSTFDSESALEELKRVDASITLSHYFDWLYHKDYALLSREAFDGIEGKIAALTLFGPTFAKESFSTEKTPDCVLCPGFLTGYHRVNMAYASTHALLGYNIGEGRIYLNTFAIINNNDHPVAHKLLSNLIKLLLK